jgi:y4mF family transcriptional regulator
MTRGIAFERNTTVDTEKKVFSSREIGEAVRKRRKKLGLTQIQLARLNACSPRFISELERGKDGASLALTLRIVNSLGLDLSISERGEASW